MYLSLFLPSKTVLREHQSLQGKNKTKYALRLEVKKVYQSAKENQDHSSKGHLTRPVLPHLQGGQRVHVMYVAPEILFKLTQKPRLTPVYFYKTISMSVPKEVGKGRLFLQPSRKSVLVQIADEEMELMDMTMASQKSGASGLGHRPLAIYFQK